MTSGYSVPCARKSNEPSFFASSSNTSMKVAPMILRFCSGSTTPASLVRNRSAGIGEHQRKREPFESRPDLIGLVLAHHPVVDEDAREAIADCTMDQHRGDRGVHSSAEAAHDPSRSDLLANLVSRLFHERRHRPVAGATADFVSEIAKDVAAAISMCNLGMEQERVHSAIRRGHGRDRGVRAGGRHRKAGRGRGHEIAVARPDPELVRNRAEQAEHPERSGSWRARTHGAAPARPRPQAPRSSIASRSRSRESGRPRRTQRIRSAAPLLPTRSSARRTE